MKYPRIIWEIGWCWGGGGRYYTIPPFLEQASGQIFKDDFIGFKILLDICFMDCNEQPVLQERGLENPPKFVNKYPPSSMR